MTKTVLHKADTRGHAKHGWLDTWHTFSFANYYNPDRISFGTLRVLNDDTIEAGMGFSTHPHDNMEIITIPLEGDLEHKDSMGNGSVIRYGDIQVMSAGTGIFHSEFNHNHNHRVKLLQIWVFPDQKNVTPRYDQMTLHAEDRHNTLQQVLSPNADDAGVWIYQKAWFHLARFDKGFQTVYQMKVKNNGLYVFIISGDVTVNDQSLKPRDGFGLWEVDQVTVRADSEAEFLLMEVPMIITS
jgi:redox-sensitive bicupin YhaK (pirin superfamily)